MAAVRSGVVASLISTFCSIDPSVKERLPEGEFGITLAAPGGLRRSLRFRDGRVITDDSPGGTGGVLRFSSWEDMTRVLSGEKGKVLPLPRGRGFLKGLKAFQLCAGEVSRAMDQVPEEGDEAALERKTRLLLTAALRGVAEVYNHDHWVLVKSRTIPAGRIGVRVAGRSDLGGVLTVDRQNMVLETGGDQKDANAVLEFGSVSVCYRVLTGTIPAMGALGDGSVMLRGKLPMIQGLFPLLDRFGELMK